MQTLKIFLDQALAIWKESTSAARFGIGILVLICIGTIVGVGIWSAQPNYVNLATNLDLRQSRELIASLDQENIPYQIRGAGSIIQVDKKNFERASILAGNHNIGADSVELEETTPWMDPANQQVIFRRNQEKQLEKTISGFANVESAKVHLGLPERQPFLRQTEAPTASVVLTIARGKRFSEQVATNIAQLVANAVPGLRPDQVVITDTAGNLYTTDENMGRLTKQEEFRANRERELTYKAQSLLANFLGVGHARVEITTDFSFPEGRTVTKEFDPTKRVATSEEIVSSNSTGQTANAYGQPSGAATGAAGTATNISRNSSTDSTRTQNTKEETSKSLYEVSSTLREDVVRTPVLNLLTVSVLVDSTKVQNNAKEIPAAVKTSIEAMIKQAVGFRDGTDQFNLEFFEFVDSAVTDVAAPTAFPWQQIQTVLKNLSLGVAALVALLIGKKTLKNLQATSTAAGPSLSGDPGSKVAQLGELVKQNPEVFSKILASWGSDSNSDRKEQGTRKAA